MILLANKVGEHAVETAAAVAKDPQMAAATANAETFVMMVLLTLLAAITLAIIKQRNLFGVVILASVYSFLMASVMIALDAVDVAMTEASVGAGISTVVLLATLHLSGSMEYPQARNVAIPLFISIVVGAALIWGTYGLPDFGVKTAPIHSHVAPIYIRYSAEHQMPPNMVTAVLADFRSFDTLGETTVVFTAGIGVLLLLQGGWRVATGGRSEDEEAGEKEHKQGDTV